MFYSPVTMVINGTPVIAYTCPGVEQFIDRRESKAIDKYVHGLYAKNGIVKNGEYNILIIWNEKKDILVDMWIYDGLETRGSGPLVNVRVFRNGVQDRSSGVSAGNGLAMLGLEEQQRWKCNSLKEYIEGKRPELPSKISVGKSFYV